MSATLVSGLQLQIWRRVVGPTASLKQNVAPGGPTTPFNSCAAIWMLRIAFRHGARTSQRLWILRRHARIGPRRSARQQRVLHGLHAGILVAWPELPHARHDATKINRGLQGLAWHTPGVGTVCTNTLLLDERDTCTHSGREGRLFYLARAMTPASTPDCGEGSLSGT